MVNGNWRDPRILNKYQLVTKALTSLPHFTPNGAFFLLLPVTKAEKGRWNASPLTIVHGQASNTIVHLPNPKCLKLRARVSHSLADRHWGCHFPLACCSSDATFAGLMTCFVNNIGSVAYRLDQLDWCWWVLGGHAHGMSESHPALDCPTTKLQICRHRLQWVPAMRCPR